ncbi:MAG: hypothetical protein AB7O39_06305 [Flavobacteriaceae bacterium]
MFSAELERFSHIVEECEAGRNAPPSLKILADLYLRLNPVAPALELRFGAVMVALFARADETSRLYAAERLAEAAHLPAVLLRYLAEGPAPFAVPVLKRSADLNAEQIARAASSFDAPLMQAIAGRGDVTGDTIDLLIACGDKRSINILACNPAAFFDPAQTERLCARGDLLPPGAGRILDAAPPDMLPTPALFRHLDTAGREAFLKRVQGHPFPHQPHPLVPDELRHHIAEGFVQICRYGRDEAIAAIARLADMPRERVLRVYEDTGGEMLTVMIRACDVGPRALGAALVLNEYLMGVSTERLRQLTRMHDSLPLAVAQWLAGAWSGRGHGIEAPANTAAAIPERAPTAARQAAVHDPAVARPGAERRGGAQGLARIPQPGREKQGRTSVN